jgi:FkbM family methyltransferase
MRTTSNHNLFVQLKNTLFRMIQPPMSRIADLQAIPSIPFLLICDGLYYLLRPRGIAKIRANAHQLYVNLEDDSYLPLFFFGGMYEPAIARLITRLAQPGMVVADVGANIGYFSLLAARQVGSHGKVYAFEPYPGNYELLVKNIEANNYTNIIPVCKAVSSTSGTLRFFGSSTNHGRHSLEPSNVFNLANEFEVEGITLDEYFQQVVKSQQIDILKIDVEGAEQLVIEGSRTILATAAPIVLLEFWPRGLRNLGGDPLALLELFDQAGYTISVIEEWTGRLTSMGPQEVLAACEAIDEEEQVVNLLLERR